MANEEHTLHEILQVTYPTAYDSVSSLRNIAKINPLLLDEVIELAMMIGINASYKKLQYEDRETIMKIIRRQMDEMPKW